MEGGREGGKEGERIREGRRKQGRNVRTSEQKN